MKTCPFCKGDIEIRRVNHMHKWGEEFYLLENVPAEVCIQCGEVFWTPERLKAIGQYVLEKKGARRTIAVPVIEMSEVSIG